MKFTWIRSVQHLCALLMAITVAGCGGGNGGGPGTDGGGTDDGGADASYAVLTGDFNFDGIEESLIVNLASPGTSTLLGAPLGPTNQSQLLQTALDDIIVYESDEGTLGLPEIFSVRYDTPGVVAKVNAPLQPLGEVLSAQLSPDGKFVAYRADQDTDGVTELYLVDLSNPGFSAKLNPALVPGGSLSGIVVWGPASDRVFYTADQDTDNVNELYMVATSNPGVATKMNGPLVANGNVGLFKVAPGGGRLIYRADQTTDGVNELYRVNISSPGASVKLNQALVANGDVGTDFHVSLDGNRVYYIADAATDDVNELWSVLLSSPGSATRLNAPFADILRDVTRIWPQVPGTQRVPYTSDESVDDVNEVFLVDLTSPGSAVKVNSAMPATGDVVQALPSVDGQRILYLADQNTDGVNEAFLVNLSALGTSTQANDTLIGGSSGLTSGFLTFDGNHVLYSADQDTAGVVEAYMVPTATPGPGNSTKLNPPLSATAALQQVLPIPIEFLLKQLGQ